MKIIIIALTLLITTGCITTVEQHSSVELNENQTVTVLDDGRTRDTATAIVLTWLKENGYTYEVVDNSIVSNTEYDQAIDYSYAWSWDLATYLRAINVKVIKSGVPVASVQADTVGCGGFDKFGDGEKRIRASLDTISGKISKQEFENILCTGSK